MKKMMKALFCVCLAIAMLTSVCALASESSGKATFYWNYDFDGNGTVNDAGDVFDTKEFDYGKNISKVSDPEREGFTFGGWYLENGD